MGGGCIDPHFTDHGSESSASCPGHFTPGEIVPSKHWLRGWVHSGTSQSDVKKREILPIPGLNSLVVKPVASRSSDCAIPAPVIGPYAESVMFKILCYIVFLSSETPPD
jgi:hypothetical protein